MAAEGMMEEGANVPHNPFATRNADDDEDGESWVSGGRASLSRQMGEAEAKVDEDYYISTVGEMRDVATDGDGDGDNNDSPYFVGGKDMVYEAAVQLCISKKSKDVTVVDRAACAATIDAMPVLVLTTPSALYVGMAALAQTKTCSAAIIAMSVPLARMQTKREAAELGFIVASELANPHSALEKCLFVIVDDGDGGDDDDNDDVATDNKAATDSVADREAAGYMTSSLMGGLMSRDNFLYWYDIANGADAAGADAADASADASLWEKLDTPAATAARKQVCGLRNDCLQQLKN